MVDEKGDVVETRRDFVFRKVLETWDPMVEMAVGTRYLYAGVPIEPGHRGLLHSCFEKEVEGMKIEVISRRERVDKYEEIDIPTGERMLERIAG